MWRRHKFIKSLRPSEDFENQSSCESYDYYFASKCRFFFLSLRGKERDSEKDKVNPNENHDYK